MRFVRLIKSARGHIWKANRHKELYAVSWAYQFVSQILSEKIAVSGDSWALIAGRETG
jgi:hypothetical protein